MNFISLFAGIGGFDLGFERAGMSCVAQVENNPHAITVLERHFPKAMRFEDVTHVGKHNLPAAELVCGGFPCQDVSVAGRRAGLAGERSGLWFEFLRILEETQPRYCVIENVPGLLSSNGGRDFAVILHGLVGCGYRVCWRVLDAQYFGVAQRRRRVFIVGSLGDGRAAEILFERESGAGHSQPGEAAREGVAATVSASPPSRRNGGSSPTPDHFVVEAIDTRNSRSNGEISGTLQSKANGGYSLNYQNPVAIHRMRGFGDYVEDTVAGVLKSRDGKDATDLLTVDLQSVTSVENRSTPTPRSPTLTPHSDVIAFNWNAGAKAGLSAGELAPTLRSGHHNHPAVTFSAQISPTLTKESYSPSKASSGQAIDFAIACPYGVRRLTPLECERLQGFPDHWTTGLSDSARYQRLGNAVCVNVAEWLGKRIMAVSS